MWNDLPGEEADTLATFKRHLVRYMDRKGLEGYRSNAANGTGYNGRLVWHVHGWVKILFLCCITLNFVPSMVIKYRSLQ